MNVVKTTTSKVSSNGTANPEPLGNKSTWWTAYLEEDEDVKKKNMARREKGDMRRRKSCG